MKINIDIPKRQSFPSIAAVPFKKGAVSKEQLRQKWHLFEDNLPVHCFKDIIALWPDQSVKWVHVHGIFKGTHQYSFNNFGNGLIPGTLPAIPADSTLGWEVQLQEGNGTVWRNTQADRAASVTIPINECGLLLIQPTGGWKYGGSEDTKVEEINDPFVRVTRYEGWLRSANLPLSSSSYRYVTRVTRYALFPSLVKISSAVVLSRSMRGKEIHHISFLVDAFGNQPVQYGADQASHTYQPGQSGSLCVHQQRINRCKIIIDDLESSSFTKSDGYISQQQRSILVRNFWEKFPQALEYNSNRLIYRQWYGNGAGFTNDEIIADGNLHKFLFWHGGTNLVNDIPKSNDPNNPKWADRYFSNMVLEEGTAEEFIEYADHAEIQGVSIHDDFAVYTEQADVAEMNSVWNRNPVGYCDASYVEGTEVMDFAARSSDYADAEQFMEDSVLSYTDSARFEDYGRFLYGDSHRNIFVTQDRPSRYRSCLSSYYCSGETYWRMLLRGGSDRIRELARRNTEHYRSIAQVSYDELKPAGDGNGPPQTKWHQPGCFWYLGRPLGPDYGQNDVHSDWATRMYRVPDPDSFLWSWILDGNRYHKDGYDLWYRMAKSQYLINGPTVSPGAARGFNKMLVYGITAFEYYAYHPQPGFTTGYNGAELFKHIIDIGTALLGLPLATEGIAGPLFHPQWIRLFIEFVERNYVPNKEQLMARILLFALDNYNPNSQQGIKTIDMASLLLDVSRNRYPFFRQHFPINVPVWWPQWLIQAYRFLRYPGWRMELKGDVQVYSHLQWIARIMKKVFKMPGNKWDGFGIGDAEFGDHMLKMQWGAFLKRLKQLNIVSDNIIPYSYHGHYPTAVQSGGDHHPASLTLSRGNEYLIKKSVPGRLSLQFRFTPFTMNLYGGFSFSELWAVSPSKYLTNQQGSVQKANKFFSVYRADTDLDPLHYPGGAGTQVNLQEMVAAQIMDEFTLFNVKGYAYNWEKSDVFMSPTGHESYTVTDSVDTNETGIFHLYINGMSIYPGLTSAAFSEAMLLRPYSLHGAGVNDSGDYMFTDSQLYLKNLSNFPVTLVFWASVIKSPAATDPKTLYGSFARIEVLESQSPHHLIDSKDMQYGGSGYGNSATGLRVTLPSKGSILLKTITIYHLTGVRMRINKADDTPGGVLLCGRSMGDIDAFPDESVFIDTHAGD